jgi:hypothetical protein
MTEPNKHQIAADLTDAAFRLASNDEFESAGRLLRAAQAAQTESIRAAMFHYHRARGACSAGQRSAIPDVFRGGGVQ